MIELMNFRTNAHVKATRFTTLFRKIVHGMPLEKHSYMCIHHVCKYLDINTIKCFFYH
jgi:hypothetical protein